MVIAAEEDGKGMGRIRLARVADASGPSLQGFVKSAVAPGSRIHTDGWDGYTGLSGLGYGHEVSVLRGQGKEAARELLPRVHQVAALLNLNSAVELSLVGRDRWARRWFSQGNGSRRAQRRCSRKHSESRPTIHPMGESAKGIQSPAIPIQTHDFSPQLRNLGLLDVALMASQQRSQPLR